MKRNSGITTEKEERIFMITLRTHYSTKVDIEDVVKRLKREIGKTIGLSVPSVSITDGTVQELMTGVQQGDM